jgi:polyvinyl alcohol dehydrogenase (cytochrome)
LPRPPGAVVVQFSVTTFSTLSITGVLRALSTSDGKVLWTFDMLRDFETVNGIPAKGGSMGASGPTVAGGMVFAGAGYPGVQGGRDGNVLLAFAAE